MTQNKKKPQMSAKNRTFSIELASYELPLFKEKPNSRTDWVEFGERNLFPLYLVDLFNQSAVHNAIITGKVNYIVGRGLTTETGRSGVSGLRDFVMSPNGYETLQETYKKLVIDNEVFNGYAIKVVRAKAGNKIVEIHHEDFTNVRMDKSNKGVWISDEWESPRSKPSYRMQNRNPEVKYYPLFDPKGTAKVSYIYHREYRPDINYYPYPEYVGAIPQIETSVEIGKFDLNSIKNGFSGGTIINLLNGIPPTDEEAKAIERDLTEKFTGSENGNRVVINFAEDKDHATTVEQINSNDLAERFANLEERTKESIFIGHKITSPMLFGVRSEGQLGGRREILEAYKLFKETYVVRRQAKVVGTLNYLLDIMGLPKALKVEELKPMNPRLPISDEEVSALIPDEEKAEFLRREFGVKNVKAAPVEENVDMSATEDGYGDVLMYLGSCGEDAENFEILDEFDIEFEDEQPKFALKDVGDYIALKKIDLATIELRYRYALADDALPLKTKSRGFCSTLMGRNALYTRQEIEGMENHMRDFNQSVWLYRGGWYNRAGERRPQCRHVWKQVVVRRNGN